MIERCRGRCHGGSVGAQQRACRALSVPAPRRGKVARLQWPDQREDRAACGARPTASRWRSTSTTTGSSPRSGCAVHRDGRRHRGWRPGRRCAFLTGRACRSRWTGQRSPAASLTGRPSTCSRASCSCSLPGTPSRMSSSTPAWCRLADRPSCCPAGPVRARPPWSGRWWRRGRATTRTSTRCWTPRVVSTPTPAVRAFVPLEATRSANPSPAAGDDARSPSELWFRRNTPAGRNGNPCP
jgi:hypothetical protein